MTDNYFVELPDAMGRGDIIIHPDLSHPNLWMVVGYDEESKSYALFHISPNLSGAKVESGSTEKLRAYGYRWRSFQENR